MFDQAKLTRRNLGVLVVACMVGDLPSAPIVPAAGAVGWGDAIGHTMRDLLGPMERIDGARIGEALHL